jgi:hypothetical protein
MKFLHLLLFLMKFMSLWNHKIYYGFAKAAQSEQDNLTFCITFNIILTPLSRSCKRSTNRYQPVINIYII